MTTLHKIHVPQFSLKELEDIAHCECYHYFSTTPGFQGRPVFKEEVEGVQQTVYMKSAPRGFLLHPLRSSEIRPAIGVKALEAELPVILSVVKTFLQRENLKFQCKDLPSLTRLDMLLRRMGAEDDNEVRRASATIFSRILKSSAEGTVDLVREAPVEDTSFAPLQSKKPLRPVALVPAMAAEFELALPTASKVTFTSREPTSTFTPKEVIPEVLEHFTPPQYKETLRDINTAWFLHVPLQDIASCKKVMFFLLEKNVKEPLTDEEWSTLARCFVLLLRSGDDCHEHAESVFLRFFLHKGRRRELPQEFTELFSILCKKNEFRDFLLFLQSVPPALCEVQEKDPNGVKLLQNLHGDFRSSRWQDCSFSFHGFSSKTPWKNEGEKRCDRECLIALCSEISKKHNTEKNFLDKESLESLSLVIAFVLSSHSLKEMPRCKKDFLTIAPLLKPLAKLLGETNPENEVERVRRQNFLKLYYLYEGTGFLSRLNHETSRPTKPLDRFSLWGVKGPHTTQLAGNEKPDFGLDLLTRSLEEVREVAIREKGSKKPRKELISSNYFSVAPPLPLWIPPPRENFIWQQIFSEVEMPTHTSDERKAAEESWQSRQERAKVLAQHLADDFARITLPIDFKALVTAVERGNPSIPPFLALFDDGGMALLRDYIYPYCTLMRLASTPLDHVAARFVSCAATGAEIADLGGEETSSRIAVLNNVLRIMGSQLQNSVIHTHQTVMLQAMTTCIEERKQVFIWNDTGSGKTTMSKLAPLIVSLRVPLVLHVAPFPQGEDGWHRMKSWNDLDAVAAENPSHFWTTAKELASLMKEAIPKKYAAILQKSFVVIDEHDCEDYVIPDTPQHITLQDRLFFTYGCRSIANMSATPNLETLGNMILRYRSKLAAVESTRDGALDAYKTTYRRKIEALSLRHEALLKAMAREWSREISIHATSSSDPCQQICQLFRDIPAFPFPERTDRSFLIEMPRFVLEGGVIDLLHEKMVQVFPRRPVAILFRDSSGIAQAHLSHDGVTWEVMPLPVFDKRYSKEEEKPIICCFYAQDSVGGDFGRFSYEGFVQFQSIVYSGEIAPSYAIFQNLRRQRTHVSVVSTVREPSRTPVFFYLGEQAEKEIALTAEEEKGIESLLQKKEEREISQKTKLIAKADSTAKDLSRLSETSRLKMKCVQKKHRLVKEVLLEDMKTVKTFISHTVKNPLFAKQIWDRLQEIVGEKREAINVRVDADVERVRQDFLREMLIFLRVEPKESPYQEITVQENEALVLMSELFTPEEKTLLASEDVYKAIQDFLGRFNCRRTSCAEMWCEILAPKAQQKRDGLLHPIPTKEAVAVALRRVRGLVEGGGIPDVAQEIDLGPVRHGVKFLPPDRMIKSMIGATSHDGFRARAFIRNLMREAKLARKYQEDHELYRRENAAVLEQLKQELLKHVDALNAASASALLQPISTLAKEGKCKRISGLADVADQYQARYLEYSRR